MCSEISGLPLGEVVPDIGYPGSPVSLVTGSLITPTVPGVYHLVSADPRASLLELGATGRVYWPTEAAGIGPLVGLTITVEYGASCSPGVGACCLPSGLCSVVLPDECIYTLGGVTHGSGTLCEGDIDGDGPGNLIEAAVDAVELRSLDICGAEVLVAEQPVGLRKCLLQKRLGRRVEPQPVLRSRQAKGASLPNTQQTG